MVTIQCRVVASRPFACAINGINGSMCVLLQSREKNEIDVDGIVCRLLFVFAMTSNLVKVSRILVIWLFSHESKASKRILGLSFSNLESEQVKNRYFGNILRQNCSTLWAINYGRVFQNSRHH